MKQFKGKGEHSVNELEAIILEQQEILYQRQISKQELKKALEKVVEWKMPETEKFWNDGVTPMSYSAAYGSNGERDYIRQIAQEAIFTHGGGL